MRIAMRLVREQQKGRASPWWPYLAVLPAEVHCLMTLVHVSGGGCGAAPIACILGSVSTCGMLGLTQGRQ